MARLRISSDCTAALVVLLASAAAAVTPNDKGKAVTIPLGHVWGSQMPGTKNVVELERGGDIDPTSEEFARNSVTSQIDRALNKRGIERKTAGPAFVVVGIDKKALANAREVIAKQVQPKQSFPIGTDLSLVFYSYLNGGYYVHIDSVERTQNKFTVNYRFVSHRTGNTTSHYALIPLGKLASGAFKVEIKQLPSVCDPLRSDLSWLVSGDTDFQVKEAPP